MFFIMVDPLQKKIDEFSTKIKKDRLVNSGDIAKELNIQHQTVSKHLKKSSYKKKLGV